MDRFTSISIFVAALEDGSLVAAGRRFGFSASMAGKHVSALESQLGVRLIQRSTRKLSATDAGRAYYLRCKRIIEEFEEAGQEASDSGVVIRGTLRIAVPVTFGELHVAPIIGRWLTAHPQVNAEVIADDRYIDLHASGIDVAIRIGRLPDSSLIARQLAPCRMVLCTSPAYLELIGIPKHPQDLQCAPRLAFSEAVSSGGWVFHDGGNNPHLIDGPVRMQANNMQMLLSATLKGLGIAYGPTFVFGPHLRDGSLIQLLPEFKPADLEIHAVYQTSKYLPSKLRSFVDYIVQELAGQPNWDHF